jgi:hypothetical protein
VNAGLVTRWWVRRRDVPAIRVLAIGRNEQVAINDATLRNIAELGAAKPEELEALPIDRVPRKGDVPPVPPGSKRQPKRRRQVRTLRYIGDGLAISREQRLLAMLMTSGSWNTTIGKA